ncbi:MAG: hypothetical protein KC503_01815 [Myxococcales bacterium]|nr:hypothetical protein [Myxococcales bacterium]
MSAIKELQAALQKASKPEQLLATYREAKSVLDTYTALCEEIKNKLAESLGEGKKLKTDDGSVSWSKGRSKLDNEAWEAAKSEKPELADIEKSAEEWKNKLKKAQSKFMAAGAPSLVIRTP